MPYPGDHSLSEAIAWQGKIPRRIQRSMAGLDQSPASRVIKHHDSDRGKQSTLLGGVAPAPRRGSTKTAPRVLDRPKSRSETHDDINHIHLLPARPAVRLISSLGSPGGEALSPARDNSAFSRRPTTRSKHSGSLAEKNARRGMSCTIFVPALSLGRVSSRRVHGSASSA